MAWNLVKPNQNLKLTLYLHTTLDHNPGDYVRNLHWYENLKSRNSIKRRICSKSFLQFVKCM